MIGLATARRNLGSAGGMDGLRGVSAAPDATAVACFRLLDLRHRGPVPVLPRVFDGTGRLGWRAVKFSGLEP